MTHVLYVRLKYILYATVNCELRNAKMHPRTFIEIRKV
jgi:hypothetical protein